MALFVRMLVLAAAVVSLTSCGLHLRGHGSRDSQFAFHSIYIQSPGESAFTANLRRMLTSRKLTVASSPGQQELTLNIVYETTEKQITALNASGHVIEYLLRYRVSLRAYDRQLNDWLPATEIQLQRVLPYDDTLVLAKQQEEQMLYDDMRTDAAQQVMRRLAYAKPPRPENP
ncbi:MAG TPA: LPS assembly lipoprotein LptE [Gallionellaceae bacterium]